MAKFIVYLTRLVVTAMVVLLFSSCKYDVELGDFGTGIKGDGNIVSESRDNDTDFTAIEISRGLDLEIEQSSQKSITVVADKNLQNHISTDINNGVLSITSDVNIRNAHSKKIIVKVPKISSLQASSAARITGVNTIKSNNLELTSSSAAEIKLTLESENVTAESSSGSNMKLRGKTLKLETHSSSGSTIAADGLMANDIISDASSGSVTEVNPLVSLKADASSGSNISYKNEPKNLDKNSSSGGSIGKN